MPAGEVFTGVRKLGRHFGAAAKPLVQVPQPDARFDAEIGGEPTPGGDVDRQCLRHAAGTVQGQHQLLGKPFPVWVFTHQLAQLGY